MKSPVDQLWDLVYRTFEARGNEVSGQIFSAKQQANVIRFRLMNSLAALKKDHNDSDAADAVSADIMLSQTIGFIPDDTADKMFKLLDQIKGDR